MGMIFTALMLLGLGALVAVVAAASVELSRRGASGRDEGREGASDPGSPRDPD